MLKGQVRLRNLRPEPRDITLLDGTNLRLCARSKVNDHDTSAPISKRILPPAVKGMVRRKEIRMMEE